MSSLRGKSDSDGLAEGVRSYANRFEQRMEIAEAVEAAEARERARALPLLVGLCPVHADEFYMPLTEQDSRTCPSCPREMVIYVRSRLPEVYR